MTIAELTEAILSVQFMLGAATALAFRKQVTDLYESVFENATDKVDGEGNGGGGGGSG